MKIPAGARAQSMVYAAFCVVLAFSWQALTVNFNYGGNWTALFCSGGSHVIPPELASENIYTFPASDGYDGQFYHYMAHDPLLQRGYQRFIDAPRMRYRRILAPGTAHLLAAGQQRLVDAAYVAAVLLFLFLGGYWLSAYASEHGRHAAWGMAFLLLPASIVSTDRLVTDGALTALTAGFVLYASLGSSRKLWVVLALAPLARETGLLLVGACCLYSLAQRDWRRAMASAAAALPAAGWFLFVQSKTAPYDYPSSPIPFQETFRALLHPIDYPARLHFPRLLQAADVLALIGLLLVLALALDWVIRRPWSPLALACLLFFLLAAFLQKEDNWRHVFDYGRIFSPLLLLVGTGWLSDRRWLAALPVLLILPRLGMQFGTQMVGIAGQLLEF